MSPPVISLHIGQAGVQMGDSLWELLCLEHRIRPDGTIHNSKEKKKGGDDRNKNAANHRTFFSETKKTGRVEPRAIMVDTEHLVVDQLRDGVYKKLYHPSTIINAGKEDASSCFARGYCSVGREMIDGVMDRVRLLSEACDTAPSFMIYHSYGGGTGSGLTALIGERLRDAAYEKSCVAEIAVNHSPQVTDKISGAMVEPYNTVLSAHKLLSADAAGWCVMLDNESLYDICRNKLDVDLPRYRNVNRVVCQAIACITASTRFDDAGLTLDDLQRSLVPYPRLKYLLASHAPLATKCLTSSVSTCSAVTRQCFRPDHHLQRFDPRVGRYVAACLAYRGDVVRHDVDDAVRQVRKLGRFAGHCPAAFKISTSHRVPCSVPFSDLGPSNRSCTLLSNTTAAKNTWTTVNGKFDKMFKHRAYTHWYLNEGMELDDFVEARDNMAALELDYDEVTSATPGDDERVDEL